jgi:predicted aminopeptidase
MASLVTLGTLGIVLLAAGAVCLTSGCTTLGFYTQAVAGHQAIVQSARPVPDWLADDKTPAALKKRLELTQRIRDYAVTELKEPDNASYRRYADLRRGAAVWNVVAAPELSLTLQTWCFPVVSCVGYRGYYDRADAEAFAASLRLQGQEASVYGVPAYSTLGMLPFDVFADPLLNTFIDYPEGELARLIFHELAHQIAFAKGDTVFNESFATAVERIGSARWLSDRADPTAREAYERFESRRQDFRTLASRYRDAFDTLYGSGASDEAKRAEKAALMARLQADYASLKAERWVGFSGYDGWFERANNASFGVLAAYNELVPNFERLFEREGRDFTRFYAEVKRLAALPKSERRDALQ